MPEFCSMHISFHPYVHQSIFKDHLIKTNPFIITATVLSWDCDLQASRDAKEIYGGLRASILIGAVKQI